MCGIAVIYQTNGPSTAEALTRVQAMTNALAHRGPDATGTFQRSRVCLGHRRLAIIDLGHRSDQPMTDISGRYTIVFNGQIYNYLQIREEIPEYPFHTTSDTEVLLAAYLKWGAECLSRINGMFAFAVYDAAEEQMFIARDRLGIKPLYYTQTRDTIVFASEIRAVLASGLVERKLDQAGVLDYLMYQSAVCPDTPVAKVHQIKPGHFAYVTSTGLTEHRYWSFGATATPFQGTYQQATTAIRELFFTSVRRRLMSDVPLGAFLSGGIDSSAIVAAMAQSSESVSTFSIGFEEGAFDETVFSRQVADKYRTDHHAILLTPEGLLDALPDALDAMDSPSADGVNSFMVSRATKRAGITVALSGLGGDELFAGYHYFRIWNRLRQLRFFAWPGGLRRMVVRLFNEQDPAKRGRMRRLAASDGQMASVYPLFRQVLEQNAAMNLIRNSGQLSGDSLERQISARGVPEMSTIAQLSIAELSGYTSNVLLKDTDQFSMASALEVRVPFFDHELVDFVLRLPDAWKIGRTPKQLLTDAMGDLLPKEIIHRPKQGFTLPWEQWLSNELADFAQQRMQYLADRPEFDGGAMLQTWEDFRRQKAGVTWPVVWQLVALSHWMQKTIE